MVAESASAGGDTERATIRARVNWSAYDVVDRSGGRRTHPAAQGELLDFDLIRGADGWRIEGISRAVRLSGTSPSKASHPRRDTQL